MSRSTLSRRYKAAYTVLYEAELEQCAARCQLERKRARAAHMLESIIDSKACDLDPLHNAEASVEWWGWVIATAARIVEEQQKWDRSRARQN
ncbi:MAG: hypothetical protein ACXV5T_09630 [Halobacteriota archaeon]